MKKILSALFCTVAVAAFTACSDDDSFSSSPNNLLTFDSDTLCLDTVFSTIPSPHRMVMVHNNSGDGLRIRNVRLGRGNQTGFRVNVHGTYLSEQLGWQVSELELRKNDSLRIFVELTSQNNRDTLPKLVSDDLIFTLESGVAQKLNLKAWSWDANILRDAVINNDTTISNEHGRPVVVYGKIDVNENATMTIAPSTTIYFHDKAGINVKGRLRINGEKGKEVILRCDRLDRMVSNLTYDNNPGQWGGITIASTSGGNEISYTDIHGATDAIICDSAYNAEHPTLTIRNSTIHNIKGNGVKAVNGNIVIENTQISNTKDTCLAIIGGRMEANGVTIAQYYPFDANRGPAFVFGNTYRNAVLPLTVTVKNSIIKGYADDVIYKTYDSDDASLSGSFTNCLLRTPATESSESIAFSNCIFEDVKDTLTNAKNSFMLFDTDNFFYNFTPRSGTLPIGKADPESSLPEDRKGMARNRETPDMGCYETEK